MGAFTMLLKLMLKAALVLVVLSREDLLSAFGHGTGINKAHITPLGISYTALFDKKHEISSALRKYPKLKVSLEKGFSALAIPGEIYNELLNERERNELFEKAKNIVTGKMSSAESNKFYTQYVKRGDKWLEKTLKHKSTKKILFPEESDEVNYVLLVGSIMCILAAFFSIFSVVPAGYIMLFGVGLMYTGVTTVTAASITEFGMTVLGAVLIGNFVLEALKPKPAKNAGRKVKTQ